jgi:tetratricopeptide (TPR) repeat protein
MSEKFIHGLSFCVAAAVLGIGMTAPPEAAAQTSYRNAQEAYAAGAKLHNARRFAESRAPFEEALKLSDDDAFKVRVYRALMQSYRQLPEIDEMLKATDFIFEHGESTAEKTLIAGSLASFVHERGKTAEAVKIYEAKLTKDPRNKPALYALTEIYRRAEPKPDRRAELLKVLSDVQKQDESNLAAKYEKLAADQPQLAGVHWKDAAAAWLKAEDKQKALAAAQKAEAAGPDDRNDQLSHFWHKGMGDVYLSLNEPKKAIPHLEMAIQKTTIAGYKKASEEQLAKARRAAGE